MSNCLTKQDSLVSSAKIKKTLVVIFLEVNISSSFATIPGLSALPSAIALIEFEHKYISLGTRLIERDTRKTMTHDKAHHVCRHSNSSFIVINKTPIWSKTFHQHIYSNFLIVYFLIFLKLKGLERVMC